MPPLTCFSSETNRADGIVLVGLPYSDTMEWEADNDSGVVFCQNPSVQCGFELGDWYSFTSLNSGELDATRILMSSRWSGKVYQAEHKISLQTGTANLFQEEECLDEGIDRTLTLEPTTPIELGDIVLRFRIDANEFPVVEIAGYEFHHRSRNRYLQFDVDKATFHGGLGTISIEGAADSIPPGMTLVTYVRDEPPANWIVHARVLAKYTKRGFLRLYGFPLARFPLLDQLVRRMGLHHSLRYCREIGTRVSYLPNALPAQYVEYVELTPGDEVSLTAKYRFFSEDTTTKR